MKQEGSSAPTARELVLVVLVTGISPPRGEKQNK